MSSLLYGRSYISQRCSVPVVCHNSNWTCTKPWGRRAEPGHFHNDHTHVDWFPELDGFDMWGQGRHEGRCTVWQSIFKCEHCEGSALASFQWKSRWMDTDYQSSTVTSTRAFNGFFFGANCHNSSSLVPNSDGEKNQCRIQSSCPAELQSNIWLFTWVAYKSFINTLRFNTATIELSIPAPRRITDGLPRQWVGAIGRNFGRDPLSLPLLLLRDPLSPIGHNFRFPLICLSLRTPTHERRNGLPKF